MLFAKKPENKRLYLRVPIKSPAKLFIDDRLCVEVRLADISTNGLSFFIDEQTEIPNILDMQLRLGASGKAIKVKLGIKNVVKFPGGARRVGCQFLEFLDGDSKGINDYVTSFLRIGLVQGAVNFAAFLCVIDAAWRILAYTINRYYLGAELGASLAQPVVWKYYVWVIGSYGVFCLMSFIFSANWNYKEKARQFSFSVFFLIQGLILLAIKNAGYWRMALWQPAPSLINAFFVAQIILLSYVTFSVVMGILSLRKVNLVSDLINDYLPLLEKKIHPVINDSGRQ